MSPVDSARDMPRHPGEPANADDGPLPDQRAGIDRRSEPSAPQDLRHRMDNLPAGHPSSPYEADGSPRDDTRHLRDLDPEADDLDADDDRDANADDLDHTANADFETHANALTDFDRGADVDVDADGDGKMGTDSQSASDQIRPLTDAQWSEHVTDVREHLGEATDAGLATNVRYTTDPDREQWTAARDRIQGDLVVDLYERAGHVPCDHQAIVAGGLGGAGKTTVLDKHAGIDLSKYLMINPDNIKEEMVRRGLVPQVAGLSPMEASELVHEESSAVAKQLARKALSDGKNVIWDITMSTLGTTERRIDDLRASGYAVDGIFVDIPVETSVRRADARHRKDHEAYRAGNGFGGRYVPPELIRAQFDPDWGSQNRKTFESINGCFDQWSRFDNSVDGHPAVLVETGASERYEEGTS